MLRNYKPERCRVWGVHQNDGEEEQIQWTKPEKNTSTMTDFIFDQIW